MPSLISYIVLLLLFLSLSFIVAVSAASVEVDERVRAHSGIDGANQVHLALGEREDEVVVTWLSSREALPSVARFGPAATFPADTRIVHGFVRKFVDNGTLHHTQWVHRVVLPNLAPRARYTYQVWNSSDASARPHVNASAESWSRTFEFVASAGPDWTNPVFTVYGDFGLENPRSMPALMDELQNNSGGDVIVHVGDFAYDMFNDNATWGDAWFNFVEPLYARVPVMVCPGNHEGMYDFLNYRERFSMPGRARSENLYYSFNAGNTHWIAYDTEVYFVYEAMTDHGGVHRNFGPYPQVAKAQLRFIEEDLIRANKERAERPWIVAFGHRPFYCSDSDDDDCVKMQDQWRVDLEKLFFEHGVDIVFEAHQHSYERLWPTYLGQVYNSTTPNEPYTNPLAPIHLVAGAAGCSEGIDVFEKGPLGVWSAVRIADYGYGHLRIHNATHATWEQLATNKTVVDSIDIVRFSHSYAKQKQ
eukprot:gnl/Spiro4/11323_TR5977_c0_g1_i2.p1 gnl/Spiro4/11323_TR5977_c0_g1~~gnl/Spiro4/11323_TR5977_c0_g1_i2.p1  ORF type:complete len:487 (-),score=163.52 gnl/Spiro4/11323_TR5977_c0_g1_i2:114-1538(-)